MSFLKEFRDFAVKGNMVDMAVGIIVGAAFGKIVSSMVADVLTPPLGVLLGGVDFSDLAITLKAASEGAPAVVLSYGVFLQALFDFTILAFVLFMVVRTINRFKRQQEAAPPAPAAPTLDQQLLSEIRDLLKSNK